MYFSDVEEKSVAFSMDQMEALFKPCKMLQTCKPLSLGSEPTNMLITKLKEEPEDCPQLVPTPSDAVTALDFGQTVTHSYLYPNNFCLYSYPTLDSMFTPLLHAWTLVSFFLIVIDLYIRTSTRTNTVVV